MAKPASQHQPAPPLSSLQKAQGIFCATALLIALLAGVFFLVPQLFSNLDKLIARHPYVSVSAWTVPMLVAVPAMLALVVGIGLRVAGRASEVAMHRLMMIALASSVAAIVTRLVYGFAVSSYLSSLGYSSCWYLSSPSQMAPTVWVNQPEYCIENTGTVRKDLLQWMDANAEPGQPLSVDALRSHAAYLLNEREKHERQEYPQRFE